MQGGPAIERGRSDDFVGCRDLLAVLGDGSLTGQGWRHLDRDIWIVNLRGKTMRAIPGDDAREPVVLDV
jgi:hypothetical protein